MTRHSSTIFLFRRLSQSFASALQRSTLAQPIDVAKAMRQHANYTRLVQHAASSASLGPGSVVFPDSPQHADCCFIEDCLVSWPGVAVLTQPAAPSRSGEVNILDQYLHSAWLQQQENLLHVHRFRGHERCDGGDVLRIKDTLFVGESERTNAAAHDRWRKICSLYSMRHVPVPVGASGLHLKSLATWVGPDVGLACASNSDGLRACKTILQYLPSSAAARVFFLDEQRAANMLRVGKTIFYRPGAPVRQLQRHHPQLEFIDVDMSELEKKDGALTCCSVALHYAK